MDGDPQAFWVKTKNFCHQFPRPRNGVFFEVVAKTEVAQHLKEDKVTLRATNIIEVVVLSTSTNTLLHRDSTVVRGHFVTHEIRLERHHSRHGEQQCGVVRNKAGRRDDGMRSVAKKLRESRPQLVCATGRTGRKW